MDAGAALKRQCPESPRTWLLVFFTRVSRYCDLPKIAPKCALFATWPGPAQAIGSLALAFRETGFPRAETDGPKSAPGGKKSPRRLNRLRQSPPRGERPQSKNDDRRHGAFLLFLQYPTRRLVRAPSSSVHDPVRSPLAGSPAALGRHPGRRALRVGALRD
jgi:hypothetical protein